MKDPIVQAPKAVLSKVAKPVLKAEFGSPALHKLITRMQTILKKEEFGVALAAPQVGESLRLFIIDSKASEKPVPLVFINPTLLRVSKKKREMSEGCLSVRGTYGTVMRHEKASVSAYDEKGKKFIHHGSGLIAHIFQHEIDHLEGILYTKKAKKLQSDQERETLREKFPA